MRRSKVFTSAYLHRQHAPLPSAGVRARPHRNRQHRPARPAGARRTAALRRARGQPGVGRLPRLRGAAPAMPSAGPGLCRLPRRHWQGLDARLLPVQHRRCWPCRPQAEAPRACGHRRPDGAPGRRGRAVAQNRLTPAGHRRWRCRPHPARAGAARCWPGWACNCSAASKRATRRAQLGCSAASTLCWARFRVIPDTSLPSATHPPSHARGNLLEIECLPSTISKRSRSTASPSPCPSSRARRC